MSGLNLKLKSTEISSCLFIISLSAIFVPYHHQMVQLCNSTCIVVRTFIPMGVAPRTAINTQPRWGVVEKAYEDVSDIDDDGKTINIHHHHNNDNNDNNNNNHLICSAKN